MGLNLHQAGRRGPTAPTRPAEWAFAALLVLAVFLAYERVRGAGFIWDDEMHLTQNPCIVGPQGLADIWTSRAARYFPLVLTTFWVEHRLWGLAPLPYHLVNVALHAGCALVLWRVLRRLGVPGALLGSALWALHPVQVESVAWVTELKNTQSGLFFLLAVLLYVRSGEPDGDRRTGAYAAALAFSALAMASKSSTVVLPVVLGLCAWWQKRSFVARDLGRLAPVAAMSAAAAVLSLWTQHLEGANDPGWTRGFAERLADAGCVAWFYLGKLAWPHPLIFIYPRWHLDPARVLSFAGTAAAAAALVFLWRGRAGRLRGSFFAAAYFLAALSPVLGILDQYYWRYSLVGDHFQYLASMGPLALAGAGLSLLLSRLGRVPAAAAACAAPLVLAGLAWGHTGAFADSETLWRDTVARNPGCWMAYNNLGASALEAGRAEDAAALFRKAIQARPDDVEAHLNLGHALVHLNRPAEAVEAYRRTLALEPRYEKALNGLGDALLRAGRPAEAVEVLQQAVALKPDETDAQTNLANALSALGRTEEAIEHCRRAAALSPADAQVHSNLGAALLGAGRVEPATAELERALALDPRLTSALVNLGNARFARGESAAALELYTRALAVDPNVAEAHNNLSAVLLQAGRTDEAEAHARRALELRPGYPQAHENLGKALFRKGDLDGAEAQMQAAREGGR